MDKRIANSKIVKSLYKSELSLIREKCAYNNISAFVLGSFNLGLTGGNGILLINYASKFSSPLRILIISNSFASDNINNKSFNLLVALILSEKFLTVSILT